MDPNAKRTLIPREIELHLNTSQLKPAMAARVRAFGGRVSRVKPSDMNRLVVIPLGNPEAHPAGNPDAWLLATELAATYPTRKHTVVIFRGCEDLRVSATVVQYLKPGEPLPIAYGRYCAQTTARQIELKQQA